VGAVARGRAGDDDRCGRADVHKKATADAESPERRSARRVLVAVTAGASERVSDPDYLKMVQAFRQR
jgi:hypothetical protein